MEKKSDIVATFFRCESGCGGSFDSIYSMASCKSWYESFAGQTVCDRKLFKLKIICLYFVEIVLIQSKS